MFEKYLEKSEDIPQKIFEVIHEGFSKRIRMLSERAHRDIPEGVYWRVSKAIIAEICEQGIPGKIS